MNKIQFAEDSFADYLYWQKQYRKMLKRINQLIQDIGRNPFDGLGKAEPLRGNLSGWWSRRIDDSNRMVYRVQEGIVEIASCRGHYED